MQLKIFLKLATVFVYVHCDSFWRNIYLEEQFADPGNELVLKTTEIINTNTFLAPKVRCEMLGWCSLVCEKENKSFILSNVQASPLYVNKTIGLNCFTNLKPDLAIRKYITDSGNIAKPGRNSSHLVNGVNTKDHGQCFDVQATKAKPKTWFLIDLGKEYNVRSVAWTEVNYPYEDSAKPYVRGERMEIRIGTKEENGNFSSYFLFDYFKGPAKDGERVEIIKKRSVRGRFISVEKLSIFGEYFFVCHLEIFPEI
ncbi:UNVERIFIED_CONTAM: hypothetical protein RMT77_005230 [Armadillidium vulgare]